MTKQTSDKSKSSTTPKSTNGKGAQSNPTDSTSPLAAVLGIGPLSGLWGK